MSLPGKLSIGILEEDNPLRSYFRFKPLLVDEDGRYAPYDGAPHYPDEASIRIVPDKNESYHFKARMREIGLFCVVDLRTHPGESDKIRPNKNYRPGGEELNASIIYSDVVRAPAADMIFEILPEKAVAKAVPEPRTESVLLREGDGIGPVRYVWEAIPNSEGMARLTATEDALDLDNVQVFELEGFRGRPVAFAIRPASTMKVLSDMPERPAHAEPKPEPRPLIERKGEPKPAAEPKPEAAAPAPEAPRAEAPAPAPEAAPAAQPAPEAQPDKPWIHHDDSILPRPVDPHLSRSEQLLAAQAGLNPRRGRSLQELIDEKWQRSRLNQLGQCAGDIATGAPVANPVDAAVSALREAWRDPELRRPLMDALSSVDEFTETLRARHAVSRQSAIQDELNALEAQRLELMGEVDRLKSNTAAMRQKLKQEIRQEEDAALAEATRKTAEARALQSKYEQLASDARMAARDAQGALETLAGDELEKKIRDVALTRRVLERLDMLRENPDAVRVPETAERIGLEAFVDRAQRCFEAAGWSLSRFEVANLCACLAVSPVMMLTGAPGSGKTAAARLLAEALGLDAVMCDPGDKPLGKHGPVAQLRTFRDIPSVILLDDANLYAAPDLFRGLARELPAEWRLIATLQNAHSGLPVRAAAWDRGFTVHLVAPAESAWQPIKRSGAEDLPAVSIAGLGEAIGDAPLPEAMLESMNRLRAAMADCGVALSRRALDEAWRYCAAMLALTGESADAAAIFDLAVAQRLLPALLAAAPIEALVRLKAFCGELPACRALLEQPLPIVI